MACNKLLFLIERLDYAQCTAATKITSTISKDLATWLLQNFDPASDTLKLSDNRILDITEEDVHATLPMGPLEVQVALTCESKNEYTKLVEQWRTRWNLGRIETPKVRKMVEQILHRGDHGKELERDYVLYIILRCIIGSMNGNCFFRTLKSLVDQWNGNKIALDVLEDHSYFSWLTKPFASTQGPQLVPKPLCSECGSEREHPMVGTNDPIENCLNEVEVHGFTQDEHCLNDPEFFYAYLKMEVVVLKHYQHRTPIDYTMLTYDLGIPLSAEQRFLLSSIKGTPTISSSPAYNYEQLCLGESKSQHTLIHAIAKYSKTHKAMLNNLYKMHLKEREGFIIYEVFNAIYCIYICINSEELYEFNAHDKAHKLWIDKEVITSMAAVHS
ncbi:LOW QUALITY PROTEIN: hypothetical protein Cgig2_006405 [Carnegiea gigantea]|uniref:Uncharacterized protein n=1 Tax=Carnegiea gigantea TaxID=171969 RepID=A0A9Q1K6I6_9CARY|nr:LOW QUALITY PROTEIN: hypothetical protein Cgig2_006405 [Carnegiea gigantea]